MIIKCRHCRQSINTTFKFVDVDGFFKVHLANCLVEIK